MTSAWASFLDLSCHEVARGTLPEEVEPQEGGVVGDVKHEATGLAAVGLAVAI